MRCGLEVFRGGGRAPEEIRAVEARKDEAFGGVFQKAEQVGLFREGCKQRHG
jgi:hypothetical protein